jgi:aerotaxis receptor
MLPGGHGVLVCRYGLSVSPSKLNAMTDKKNAPREYVVENGELLVLLADAAGNFLYANPAYLKASGYDWADIKGTESARMMHRDNPPQIVRDMIVTIGGRQPWTGIIKNRRKTGEYYWLRLNISPIYAKRKYAGCLMVHSRPSTDELAEIEPLYKLMLDGKNKNLMLRHGRAFRATRVGKALQWGRELGLKGHLWATMASLNGVALGGLLLSGVSTTSLGFWLTMAAMVGASSLATRFLFRSIVLPLRDAVRFANQIAAGDLGSQLSSKRSDEIGSVMRALTQMNMNMRATVLDVRDGVGLMRGATAEIASGTLDLSSRTEHQASNLEQTAASMEQINTTVRTNADTARQASSVAAAACTAAEAGGQVVGEVIATMEGITKSSKQIAEIVGVIDGIAFQTNILALNAAVEAARAGEQGRGFAVVAAEVRSLAQRSATSAKEIRTLIAESVSKVSNGSQLVNDAGKTMEDVVVQVRKVTELVGTISQASHEQSAGIGQINQAVTDLDHMTQQNAALVEQSTASAESLSEQAKRLVDVVGVFKLSQAENEALYQSINAKDARAAQAKAAKAVGL